jgi:hypothetical protein
MFHLSDSGEENDAPRGLRTPRHSQKAKVVPTPAPAHTTNFALANPHQAPTETGSRSVAFATVPLRLTRMYIGVYLPQGDYGEEAGN